MARRKLHDEYFNKAKAEGYLARSAYKLQEIQERQRLIRPGDRVLDLGCAPGAWLQVAAEIVGPRGAVVGIDLTPTRHDFGPGVRAIVGDAYKIDPRELTDLLEPAGPTGGAEAEPRAGARPPFDVILSDMAPNTTGAGDDFLSARLCRRVLELLPPLLKPGGNLAMKIFEGSDYTDVLRETQRLFRDARGFKPKASREMSREMYIVARGYRGANG